MTRHDPPAGGECLIGSAIDLRGRVHAKLLELALQVAIPAVAYRLSAAVEEFQIRVVQRLVEVG